MSKLKPEVPRPKPPQAQPRPPLAAPPNTPDTSEMTALKARAYDILATIEHWQGQLRQVNQALVEAAQKAPKG